MKWWATARPVADQFEEFERLLQRELTPQERRWLRLADLMLRKAEREYIQAEVITMAA
jgi:hypothetical protein